MKEHHKHHVSRSIVRMLLPVLAWLFMVAVNALANILPIGGVTTGEMSDRYASMFTPAGFTFAIWSVIYLGLLVYVIVQALPRQRTDARLARMEGPFLVNGLLNAAWIVAWHYNVLWLSMLIMLGILWTLIVLYRIVQEPAERWFVLSVRAPIAIYTAWICMATLANLSILQSAWGLNDVLVGEVVWTLGKLFVAAGLTVWVFRRYRDPVFVAVVAWAAYGIQAAQSDGSIIGMVAAGISLVGVATILLQGASRFRTQSQTT
jgi:benzodiazapine receptor